MINRIVPLILIIVFLYACAPTKKVDRVDPETVTDLSGQWNETDARLVAEDMIKDVVGAGWLPNHLQTNGNERPIVIVGNVENQTMEHIDTNVFIKDLERELINSGRVKFVASPEERGQVRQERTEQQQFASFETSKRMAQELGADYMLIGGINAIYDEGNRGKDQSVFYTTNLELINIETNEKVWIGNKRIKKAISRRRFQR